MAPRSFSQDGAYGAASSTDPVSSAAPPPPSSFQQDGNGLSTPASNPAAAAGLAAGFYGGDGSSGGGFSRGGARGGSTSSPDWRSIGSSDVFQPSSFPGGFAGFQREASFEDGGAVEDTNGSPQQDAISKALDSVDGILAYTRKLHGLGSGDNEGAIPGVQMAGRMPSVPGSQSESGVPPRQPAPGPLPPTSNPFGKRTSDAGGTQMAARMPSVPGNQSESGVKPIQPAPGPLPPTSNPFGKRVSDASDNDDDQGGAIDTSDEETA